MSKFRFGLQSFSADSLGEWKSRAQRAEDLGYDVFSLADHFLGPGPALESTFHPLQNLAAVPAMAVAAEATSSIRIACRVFCIDYRHPVMLAKEVATLDLLSEGRIEIGLGAGWLQAEYASAGIDFDPPGVRISRLEETIAVLKRLMADGQVSYKGEHILVEGFEGAPQPVQKPHPPIMIGGGSRRVLQLAAREANIVSLNFNNRSGILGPDGVQSGTEEATQKKLGWVKEAAGDRFDDLELEIGAYFTFVTDEGRATAEGMAKAFGLETDEFLHHPHALCGSVDAICEELERRRELFGISYITVGDSVMEAFAPVVARLG